MGAISVSVIAVALLLAFNKFMRRTMLSSLRSVLPNKWIGIEDDTSVPHRSFDRYYVAEDIEEAPRLSFESEIAGTDKLPTEEYSSWLSLGKFRFGRSIGAQAKTNTD